jgi:hypothetical protein
MPDTRPDCSSFPISVKDTDRPQGDQIDRWGALQAENKRLRAALRGLVDALAANDEDGLTEFAPQMQAARAALAE